jgi:flavin reductase (DIM6/NTAB) family NADH-FMN oxidoreductase RutF
MDKEHEEEVLFCGKRSRRNLDKFQKTSLEKEEAETIDCPKIKQALGFLECGVANKVGTGAHILFIAEVISFDLKQKSRRLFHLEGDGFITTEE